jgi:hypothetical protein
MKVDLVHWNLIESWERKCEGSTLPFISHVFLDAKTFSYYTCTAGKEIKVKYLSYEFQIRSFLVPRFEYFSFSIHIFFYEFSQSFEIEIMIILSFRTLSERLFFISHDMYVCFRFFWLVVVKSPRRKEKINLT